MVECHRRNGQAPQVLKRVGVVGVAVVTDLPLLDDPVAAASPGRSRCSRRWGHRSRRHTLRLGRPRRRRSEAAWQVFRHWSLSSRFPSSRASKSLSSSDRSVRTAIAAASRLALVAGVVVELIPIVADLGVRVVIFEVGAHDAVAATPHLTGVEAGVVVLGVAVIAGFILGERPVLDVGSQRAVSADRHLAGIGAAIGRVGVAVIALLSTISPSPHTVVLVRTTTC